MIQIKLTNDVFDFLRFLPIGLEFNEKFGRKLGFANSYELLLNSNIGLKGGKQWKN